MGKIGTRPIAKGTLNGRSCSGALNRSTISATFTATKTSKAPKEDIPATILISPNNKNPATAAITTIVVTHGTFCALVLVINFGSSPTLAIPKSNLLMDMIPLKAALAVAKSAAIANTTGNQLLRLEDARESGESTFAKAEGSAIFKTVKAINK